MDSAPSQNRPFLQWLRGLLGILLLWAAVSKLADPLAFLGNVYAYELPLPRGISQFVAMTLPWVELLCGLMLLANVWTEAALCLTMGLLATFILATGQAWMRGLDIGCGCFDFAVFGSGPGASSIAAMLEKPAIAFFRNVALLFLSGYLLKRRLPQPSSA